MTKLNSHGVSIVGVVIGFVLLAMAGYFLSRTFTQFSKTGIRADRGVQAEEVLSSVSNDLFEMTVDELSELCTTHGAFPPGDGTGVCVSGDQLFAPGSQPAHNAGDPRIHLRLSWEGNPDANGPFCAKINQCLWRAERRILEISLAGFWSNPGSHLARRNLTFRRVRR